MRFSQLFSLLAALIFLGAADYAAAADGTAGAGNVADSQPAEGSAAPESLLELAEAYRSGFFELCWSSVFEIYDSSVKAAAGFSSGSLSGPEAQDALTSPGLLLSTIYTALVRIEGLTAAEDSVSRSEIEEIEAVVKAQDELNIALLDWFGRPGPETEKQALALKGRLEELLGSSPAVEPAAQP
ncbi:hypothetical protein IT575_05520 [bacterium]|nr:hypothetical protein [bacterium]